MVLVSLQWQVLAANAAFADLVGGDPAELTGIDFGSFFSEEERAVHRSEQANLLAGDAGAYRRQGPYLDRSGRTLHGLFVVRLVRDSGGTPRHLWIQLQEAVAPRPLSETAHAKTEAFLRLAGQVARVGAWGHDVGHTQLEVSRRALIVLGLDEQAQVSTAEALDLFAEPGRSALRVAAARALRTGDPFEMELPVRGSARWVRVFCEAARDAAGHVVRLHGAVQDVTEARKVRIELAESQRALQRLIGNLNGMVYRCGNSPDWPIDFASDGALALTGYEPEQLAGQQVRWGELMHAADAKRVWEEVQQALAERRRFQLTYRIRTAKGQQKWVWEQGAGVYDARNRLLCLEGIITDITDWKRAEREVELLNRTLEEKVRRRTRQLEEANSDLEAFAYAVSHDLKAPLAAIDGFTVVLTQLLEGRLSEREAGYMQRVRQGVANMFALVDAMLALHHFTQRTTLRKERLDVSDIAAGILFELQEQAPGRVCELDIEPGITLHGDRALVTTALRNLLANAWKFTAHREVTRISVRRLADAPPGSVGVVIADNGAGFAPEQAGRLFAPFQRLHDQAEFPGTGIGLATTLRIARRHGGSVAGTGEVGQGATFSFALPEPGEHAEDRKTPALLT